MLDNRVVRKYSIPDDDEVRTAHSAEQVEEAPSQPNVQEHSTAFQFVSPAFFSFHKNVCATTMSGDFFMREDKFHNSMGRDSVLKDYLSVVVFLRRHVNGCESLELAQADVSYAFRASTIVGLAQLASTPLFDQASNIVGLAQSASTPLFDQASTSVGLAQSAIALLLG